ncbi:GTPase IMAP family member 2-like, partial [Clarias magur]
TERLHRRGGRGRFFTPEQEEAICTMVRANNAIKLRKIQSAIVEDNNVFINIQYVSISTIDRVLKRHHITMKKLYCISFERNEDRVKELR